MVIDISEQILWFRRVTHEDCAPRMDGMSEGGGPTDGDRLDVSGKRRRGEWHILREVCRGPKNVVFLLQGTAYFFGFSFDGD